MDRSQVKKLLDFSFDQNRLFGFVDAGFNRETFDKNIARLTEIGDAQAEVKDILSEEEIRRLIKRLHKLWMESDDESSIELSLLEARSVGYGLEKSTELGFVYFLHRILGKPYNWTPSCLKGFLHSTLRLWNYLSPAVKEANSAFIARHVKQADAIMASVYPYISLEGPAKLGSDTRKQKKSYIWLTSAVLMPTTRLNYSYFSDALVTYYQDAKQSEYEDLKSALDLHNQARTDKILLPILIKKSSSYNKNLLDITTKRIGDPFDEAKWAPFEGATQEQKVALRQARKTLLGWVMQEIIRSFFEVLCNDKERKDFWMKHAYKVSNFYVFGSYWSKQQVLKVLPMDSVLRHFKTVESSVDNCALAMYFGDYVIIEFTEVGALYAYKVNSVYYKQTFKSINSLSKVDDLKVPSIVPLYDLDYHRFAREGKMTHRGSWAFRMNNWIDRQVTPTLEE